MAKPKQLSSAKRKRRIKKSSDVLVDVCLPMFGDFEMGENAIKSVAEAARPLSPDKYKIIAVDNGTPEWIDNDGDRVPPEEMSAGVAELLRPQDTFFRIEQNKGYPGGMNEAAARGNAPLILLLTADVVMKPGSLHTMVRVLDDPTVSVVGMKLIFPDDGESPHGPAGKVQHCGIAVKIDGTVFHPLMGWSPNHRKVNVRRDATAVTGACFMTRRRTWNAIGGFDQKYGLGTFEDVDYCFEVRERQERVIYEPDAEAYHFVGGSIKRGANRGFNLPLNQTMFRGKWAHRLFWDEWKYW